MSDDTGYLPAIGDCTPHRYDYFITRPLTEDDIPPQPLDPRPQYERHAIICDLHYRTYAANVWDYDKQGWRSIVKTAHDPRALSAAEVFMQAWEPQYLWYNGDMIDSAQLSRFDKEPQDIDGFEQDVQGLRALLWRHKRLFPDTKMRYTLGNHEARLQSYLRKNAGALRWLTSLDWHSLLDSKALNLPIYEYKERVPIIPGVLEITHGDKIAQKSGYTAHKMLEAGVSGVSGHVHRLGAIFKTDRTRTSVWFEGGCLCRLDPEYLISPNWQQGMVVLFVDRTNQRYHGDLIPIINGRIVYAGRVYESTI